MSFGQPLPLGSESLDELVIVNVQKYIPIENYLDQMKQGLPDGFAIKCIVLLHHEKGSRRIPTPMQSYGGSLYRITGDHDASGSSGSGNVLENALEEVFHGYQPERVETEDVVGGYEVFLPHTAPGLGRLLKQSDHRDRLRVQRVAMYARALDPEDGSAEAPVERLIAYYRTLPNCVGAVSADSVAVSE